MSAQDVLQGMVYKTVVGARELEVHAWALFGETEPTRIELRLGDEVLVSEAPVATYKHAAPERAAKLCAATLRLTLDRAATVEVVQALGVFAVAADGRAGRLRVSPQAAPYFVAAAEQKVRQPAIDKLRSGKMGGRVAASYAVARLCLLDPQQDQDEISEMVRLLANSQLALGKISGLLVREMLKVVNVTQLTLSFPTGHGVEMACALLACAALSAKAVSSKPYTGVLQKLVQEVPSGKHAGLSWAQAEALVMAHFYLTLIHYRAGEMDAAVATAEAAMPIMKSLLVSIPLAADEDYPLAGRVVWAGYVVFMLAYLHVRPVDRYVDNPASVKEFQRHVQRLLPSSEWMPVVSAFLGEQQYGDPVATKQGSGQH